jgi:radical SAM superfamily enzyme YgiQ (UPF0313 family)
MDEKSIVLINHQGLKVLEGIQNQSPAPPIGLAYIGAYLKKNGFQYTAIDACGNAIEQIKPYKESKTIFVQGLTNDEILARIPKEAKVIGFTCLFSPCWPLVLEIATLVRPCFPNALFVIGGEHPTALPEESLKDTPFDLAVAGEGEETFLEIVQSVLGNKDWKKIAGIIYYDKSLRQLVKTPPRKRIISIDEIPYPDWENWSIEEYIRNKQIPGVNLGRAIPILGSRGCPYNCKFCSNENMWTARYIMRNPNKLVDEMEFFKKKYNLDGFAFMDLTFIINRNKTKEFAKELIQRKLNIRYQLPSGTRCEAFDEELPELLEKSGLCNFAFAPESGDADILKEVRKKISLESFYKAIEFSLKTKMTVCCFVVIGFPEDTRKTLKSSLAMIRKLAILGVHDVTISKFTPYPGSDYFKQLREEGTITTQASDLRRSIDFFSSRGKSYCKEFNFKQLFRWMILMYLNFYVLSFLIRPWRVVKNFTDYFLLGRENTRYMRLVNDVLKIRKKWKKLHVIQSRRSSVTKNLNQ